MADETRSYDPGVFFGGIPTDAEVELLNDKFGVPEPGTMITYGEVEETIGREHGSNRWRSVTGRWRRELQKCHNIIMEAVPNEGFQALTPSGRVRHSESKIRSGTRSIRRGLIVASRTDTRELGEEELGRLAALQRYSHGIREGERQQRRKDALLPGFPAPKGVSDK